MKKIVVTAIGLGSAIGLVCWLTSKDQGEKIPIYNYTIRLKRGKHANQKVWTVRINSASRKLRSKPLYFSRPIGTYAFEKMHEEIGQLVPRHIADEICMMLTQRIAVLDREEHPPAQPWVRN